MSDSKQPQVTVLMPVYNASTYLREAIDSVLSQTFTDFELLMINDGSTDESVSIIDSYDDPRIRLLHNDKNLGVIDTLNKGLAEAKGEWIARQDADDISHSERLEKQVQVLEQDSEVALVGSWMQLVDTDNQELGVWQYPESSNRIRWASLFNSAVGHPTVMFRANLVRKAGGYSADFPHAEDFDLWSRLLEYGQFKNIGESLVRYRVHSQAVSTLKQQEMDAMRFRISRRSLQSLLPETSEEVLTILGDHEESLTGSQLKQTVDAFELLEKRFIEKYKLSSEAANWIRRDILDRVGAKAQQLGVGGRMACLWSKRRLFPKSFWLKGKFMLFLLSDGLKARLKGLLGKRHGGIQRAS